MRWLVAVSLLVACGDSPRTYEVQVAYTPLLFEYRSGSEAWQTPDGIGSDDGSTTYEVTVDDDYEIVAACTAVPLLTRDPTGIVAMETFQTRDETPHAPGYFCAETPTEPTASVFGDMVQAGTVFGPGDVASSTAGPWSYELTVPSGLNDVAATDDNDNVIAIRHDQNIPADLVEPTFDLASEGGAIQSWSPLVTPPSGVMSSIISTSLLTKNGAQVSLGFGGRIAPVSQLVAGDMHWTWIDMQTETAEFDVDTFYATAPPTTFELLAAPSGVAFADRSASWSALPDGFSAVDLTVDDGTNYQSALATPGWLAAHATSELAFDASVPGLDPSWNVTPRYYSLVVDGGFTTGATDSTDLSVSVGSASSTARRARHRRHPAQLRR